MRWKFPVSRREDFTFSQKPTTRTDVRVARANPPFFNSTHLLARWKKGKKNFWKSASKLENWKRRGGATKRGKTILLEENWARQENLGYSSVRRQQQQQRRKVPGKTLSLASGWRWLGSWFNLFMAFVGKGGSKQSENGPVTGKGMGVRL